MMMKYSIDSTTEMDTNTYTHSTFETRDEVFKEKSPKMIETPKTYKCTIYKFLVFLLTIISTITKKEDYQKSLILYKMLVNVINYLGASRYRHYVNKSFR